MGRASIIPMDSVSNEIQQDAAGIEKRINEVNVYFTNNNEVAVATWNIDLSNYTLFAPVSEEEMQKMIESIKEVNK